MRMKYSCYEYTLTKIRAEDTWDYIIHCYNDVLYCTDDIESDETYETREDAKQAAIDHIDRLESGER